MPKTISYATDKLREELQAALTDVEGQTERLSSLSTVASQTGSGGALTTMTQARLQKAESRRGALRDSLAALDKLEIAMQRLTDDGHPGPIEEPEISAEDRAKAMAEIERLRKVFAEFAMEEKPHVKQQAAGPGPAATQLSGFAR